MRVFQLVSYAHLVHQGYDMVAGGTPGILAYPELMALASRTLKGASLPC